MARSTNAIEHLQQRAHRFRLRLLEPDRRLRHLADADPVFTRTTSTYGRAFWVGLLNTLLVAGLGIVFATILGFIVGIARLSKNWLLSRVADRLCRD